MQFFTTIFPNETPTTRYQTQLQYPGALYLMKHDTNYFLIEPIRNHTIPKDKLRIGSFYRTSFGIGNNSKVFLEAYDNEIEDATTLVVKGKIQENFYKILKTIKYINVGLTIDNCEIIKINGSSSKAFAEEIPKFYKFGSKTRLTALGDEISFCGLEKQQKEFEALIYAPLFQRLKLKKYQMNINTIFVLDGDKGMKKCDFVKKVCQKNGINNMEYDFIKNGYDSTLFHEKFKSIEEMKPCICVLKNFMPKNPEIIGVIETITDGIRKSDSEFGIIFVILTDNSDQLENIKKKIEIDVIYKIESMTREDLKNIVVYFLKKIPNDITHEEVEEMCDYLNQKTIKEIEGIFGRVLEDKIYKMDKIAKTSKNTAKSNYINFQDNIKENSIRENKEFDFNNFFSSLLKNNGSNETEKLQNEFDSLRINQDSKESCKKEFFLSFDDFKFKENKKIFRPNNEVINRTNVFFKDIGGYEDVKQTLIETVIWPLQYKNMFSSLKIRPTNGVLFHGPPGCSKTLLAKAISNESKMSFISIKGSELEDKYVGETGKAIRNLFDKARKNSPCIIFIDEIDTISRKITESSRGHHSTTLATFLTEMDGIDECKDVIVMGATNRIESIDPAFMRPGRIDKIIHIDLPDIHARKKIFEIKLNGTEYEEIDYEKLLPKSEGLSGAEITVACQEALMIVLRRRIKGEKDLKLTTEIILTAIDNICRKEISKNNLSNLD